MYKREETDREVPSTIRRREVEGIDKEEEYI